MRVNSEMAVTLYLTALEATHICYSLQASYGRIWKNRETPLAAHEWHEWVCHQIFHVANHTWDQIPLWDGGTE